MSIELWKRGGSLSQKEGPGALNGRVSFRLSPKLQLPDLLSPCACDWLRPWTNRGLHGEPVTFQAASTSLPKRA
ncbi:hypothetical protein VTK73DRAFT_1501 [Phialemonium thermophilum]|uniref:Uncharacterized protein n=1 Tax=Phialemonium thermophilum TaxID=223376 RepID=A0ABR3VTI9_9PEZI